jgi:PTH1 family peptidyl-tRNA hydrolase
MKLVVGLGNPGPRYETTRHNIGFLAIDRLADEWRAQDFESAFDGQVAKADFRGEKALLVKPQTFMNRSGLCVGPLLRYYKLTLEDLIVLKHRQ